MFTKVLNTPLHFLDTRILGYKNIVFIPGPCTLDYTQLTFTCSKSVIETLEKSCEICSKLTIKTPERRIVNFEHISQLFSNVTIAEFSTENFL